jgi:superfamily I DNA/RNA helicase
VTFTPTPEQEAIRTAARSTKDNLLITALAGAAKTSTLVLIAKALSTTPTLCLAFNKRIATEMQTRLPGNCTSRTLNSVGHEAWKKYLGRNLVVNSSKTYAILTSLVEDLDPKSKNAAYENFSEILKAIDAGKTAGYVPSNTFPNAHGLMDDSDLGEWLDEKITTLEADLIRAASVISIKMGLEGEVDFNDQILLPVIFPAPFAHFPLVMIDEAQDLSALNHAMLRKLVTKRLIAVGDPCQAIYGFRGAHEDSMTLLRKQFSMKEFPLTISFRCPIEVVKLAQFHAPKMQWPEWAKPGLVDRLAEWNADTLPPEAVILCRNNAPLFNIAIKLLKNGRHPELIGNDIGKALVKILRKFGKPDMSRDQALQALADWQDKKLAKAKDPSKVEDQAACLRIFLSHGKTLGDAITFAEHIFSSTGPVKLMTGHKAKGLEFDHVYFLDEELIGDKGQERNLRYVIITRAKETLTFIDSKDFEDA